MKRTCSLLLLVVATLAVACGAVPSPPDAAPPVQAPPAPPEPALFEFHSGFWLNLHQRLYVTSIGRRPAPPGTPPPPSAPAWATAMDFYKQRFGHLGGLGMLFNDDLVALNRTLSQLDSAPALARVEPQLAAQLDAAASAARGDWPEQDRANHAWIAALEPAIARHGKALQAALVAALRAPWPSGPIRVDVSRFAGPFGAYTMLHPVHITISSGDPAYAGDASLEMLFHEASHALIEPIEKKLDAEAARRGRGAPKDLWHALLFYTAGELVKRQLGPTYVPYATKNGVWARGWSDMEAALRRDWQPYLDGRVDVDHAVSALLEDLPESPPPPAERPKAALPSRARRLPSGSVLASPVP